MIKLNFKRVLSIDKTNSNYDVALKPMCKEAYRSTHVAVQCSCLKLKAYRPNYFRTKSAQQLNYSS